MLANAFKKLLTAASLTLSSLVYIDSRVPINRYEAQ